MKHRSFTPQFKAETVLALLTGQRHAMDLAREYQLKPQQLSAWKAELVEHAALLFQRDPETDALHARIAELEQLVGRLTLELEATKKVSRLLTAPAPKNGRS